MALVTRTAGSTDLAAEINACDTSVDVLYVPAGTAYTCNLTSTVTRTKKLVVMPAPGLRVGDVKISNSAASTSVRALTLVNLNKVEFLNIEMADRYHGGGSHTIQGGNGILTNCLDVSFVNCGAIGFSPVDGSRNITFDSCDVGGVAPAEGQRALIDASCTIGVNIKLGQRLVSNVRFRKCNFHDTVAWDTLIDGNTGSQAAGDGDFFRFLSMDGLHITDCQASNILQVTPPTGGTTHTDLFSFYNGSSLQGPAMRNIYITNFKAGNDVTSYPHPPYNESEVMIDSEGQVFNIHLENVLFWGAWSTNFSFQNVVGLYAFNCISSFNLGGNNGPSSDNRLEEVYIVNNYGFSLAKDGNSNQSPFKAYADHCVVGNYLSGGITATNTPIATAKFVDSPTDLHSAAGSPLIDAGTPAAFGFKTPTQDLDGNDRDPVTPDIGAYEFV